jgi:hypothetical protein
VIWAIVACAIIHFQFKTIRSTVVEVDCVAFRPSTAAVTVGAERRAVCWCGGLRQMIRTDHAVGLRTQRVCLISCDDKNSPPPHAALAEVSQDTTAEYVHSEGNTLMSRGGTRVCHVNLI